MKNNPASTTRDTEYELIRPLVRPKVDKDRLIVQPDFGEDNKAWAEWEITEAHRRDGAAILADYASMHGDGRTRGFDPRGDYQCGDCNRHVPGQKPRCTLMAPKVVLDLGASSCKKWEDICGGDPELDFGEFRDGQYTAEQLGFGTAIAAEGRDGRGFGCHRCDLQELAVRKDSKGRSLFCKWWGARVDPNDCCGDNDAPSTEYEGDKIVASADKVPEVNKELLAGLKDDDFAVPGKRKLRINDARHTCSAWGNIDATQGLTQDEKAEARRRIIKRASELGIDTKDWHRLKAISLEAMALNLSNDDDHPNKMPFSGVMTRIDEPSDFAPGGSGGRRIIVTKAAAERALPSLLGMAVDFTPSFDGHDAQTKIGIITSADIVGNAIEISGFIYAADFPETADLIKALKDVLGFSFEAQRLWVMDPSADILTITDLSFTGAAILRKDKAAYTNTSLKAKKTETPGVLDMDKDELKALLDAALSPLAGRLSKLEAGSTAAGPITAADVAATVQKALADQAEQLRLQAQRDTEMKASIAAAVEAATKPLADQLAVAQTQLKDAVEASRRQAEEPARKTVSPQASVLLSKVGLTMPEGDGKITAGALDTALKNANLSLDQRFLLKNELSRVGVLDQGAK